MIIIAEIEKKILSLKEESIVVRALQSLLVFNKSAGESTISAYAKEKKGEVAAGTTKNILRNHSLFDDNLKVSLSPEDKACARIIYVLINPEIYTPYLAEINTKLQQKHLGWVESWPVPSEYHKVHQAYFPRPASYAQNQAIAMMHSLESLLLAQEQKHSVNLGRTPYDVPVFYGQVETELGNKVITDKLLWNDFDGTALFLHGRFSHRLQHYITTRALEDEKINFNDLPNVAKTAVFKSLVMPGNTTVLYSIIDGEVIVRLPWHIALDCDNYRPELTLFEGSSLCGPMMLMEILLSQNSFNTLPYLAHTLYFVQHKSLLWLSKVIQKNIQVTFEVLCKYYLVQDLAKSPDDLLPYLDAINTVTDSAQHDANLTPKTDNAGGGYVRFIEPQAPLLNELKPYRTPALKLFFDEFDKRNYSRALRMLAHNPQIQGTYDVAEILLRHKSELSHFNIDEKTVSTGKAAYELAKDKNFDSFCNLLSYHGAQVNDVMEEKSRSLNSLKN